MSFKRSSSHSHHVRFKWSYSFYFLETTVVIDVHGILSVWQLCKLYIMHAIEQFQDFNIWFSLDQSHAQTKALTIQSWSVDRYMEYFKRSSQKHEYHTSRDTLQSTPNIVWPKGSNTGNTWDFRHTMRQVMPRMLY